MLRQDPGFARVDVLYSDGESALSDENVRQLQGLVPRLRKVIRYKPQQVGHQFPNIYIYSLAVALTFLRCLNEESLCHLILK